MTTKFCLALATVLSAASVALVQPPAAAPLPTLPTDVAPDAALPPPDADGPDAGPAPAKQERFWVGAEYLLWWFKDSPLRVPLMVTQPGPARPDIAAAVPEVVNVLLGDGRIDTGTHQGARFTAGFWLDNHCTVGLEAGYFFLASHSTSQVVPANGSAAARVLALPFRDADLQGEPISLVAPPSFLTAIGLLDLTSRLQGAEANLVVLTCARQGLRVEVLTGFRFLDFQENLGLATNPVGIERPNLGGENAVVVQTFDHSDAESRFFGGQIGARAEYRLGRFSADASATVALGDMYETVHLGGAANVNVLQSPNGEAVTDLLATALQASGTVTKQTPPIFYVTRHELTVIPEVGVTLGYQIIGGLRAFVGYDFLYVSSVVRPGDPFDRNINVPAIIQSRMAGNPVNLQLPPTLTLAGTDFWAQGLHLGLEYRY
jgi:Putative beta barrel porin-7 (BBP7)